MIEDNFFMFFFKFMVFFYFKDDLVEIMFLVVSFGLMKGDA